MRAELHWRGRSGTALLDGSPMAQLHRGRWREVTDVVLDGRAWTFTAHHNELTATGPDGAARHRARSEGCWRRRWSGSLGGHEVHLSRVGWAGWRITAPSGALLGTLRVGGRWTARTTGELTGCPADAAVFLLWWVDLLSRRARTAAGVGGAAVG